MLRPYSNKIYISTYYKDKLEIMQKQLSLYH